MVIIMKKALLAVTLFVVLALVFCTNRVVDSSGNGTSVAPAVSWVEGGKTVLPTGVDSVRITISSSSMKTPIVKTLAYSLHEAMFENLPRDISITITVEGLKATSEVLYKGEVSVSKTIGDTMTVAIDASQVTPIAPSNLTATALSPHRAQLSWSDNTSNENYYHVIRRTGTTGSWSEIIKLADNSISFIDTSCMPKIKYQYRVFADNLAGSSDTSDTATVTMPDTASNVNYPPTFTTLVSTLWDTVIVGTIYRDTIEYSDENTTDTLTLTASPGITVTGNKISWVPSNSDIGSKGLWIIVKDQKGAQDSIGWVVVVKDTVTTGTQYTLTVTNGIGGGEYAKGTSVNISAGTPGLEQTFDHWGGTDSSLLARTDTIATSITMPARNVSVVAMYRVKTYALTVTHGTGSGTYPKDSVVKVVASLAGTDSTFDHWGGTDSALLARTDTVATTFTMPGKAAVIVAKYKVKTYALTVTRGTGSGTYPKDSVVKVVASVAGTDSTFDHWGGADSALLARTDTVATTFSMPGKAAVIVARYKVKTYALTVTGGTGSGNYAKGANVPIVAGTPTAGKKFDRWGGADSTVVASLTSASTNLTMPGKAATVVAVYGDTSSQPLYGMVLIPAGTFTMGNQTATGATKGDEAPAHDVTLSAFSMDSTVVTQAEYLRLMGINPSHFSDDIKKPVEMITWFDAVLYCNKRSKEEGMDTVYTYTGVTGVPGNGCTDLTGCTMDYSKKGYRLPTEAEWEYTAKAGTTSDYSWGDSSSIVANAWYSINSGDSTHEVATKTKNPFGLYDMAGNVWQYCNDWYGYYGSTTQVNPTGATTPWNYNDSLRVIRGGSSYDIAFKCRSSFRNNQYQNVSNSYYLGFRCVLPK